ncbi:MULTISPECIES: 3'-5' exonuclease [Roseivirga]|jgi:DNA polymerase-3 subunit epsilon|uniref:DNA polymerase III subunit epsilon n=1 Tax=Roseivirga spongicola TaxID=333140 RepID=A0A150X1B1_9BACT|nr:MULTISPECIES: 3'-5' exonuclease [Roseivirga]PWL28507.1 MAG: 3'-5' exonuclease [Roseivirga sp. XM-24bin3]KYG72534.1 DNA polymerase III subunit epsilon [Roseivirga spongicola]MBO6659473.1 3'-5' exonuclease [Roseivirga sp.]MBO6762378.1 3'-5' exonuclease [Roseivirga sp.]MBO6907790.1 3'-5' exonuclease [Roseivirga sp.]
MQLNLKNPLVFFDLETTGINIAQDRIVELAFLKVMPNGETEKKVHLVNPTIPIPEESAMIHGIRDEDVADKPTFKELAKNLAKFLEGCDLGGFNIVRFDVPLLVEEFLRAGVDFEVSQRKLIDAQKVFFLMEQRTLTAAYKFYCGKELEGAHGAEADNDATYEVFKAQIEKYNGQAVTDASGRDLGKIENNMASIHHLVASNMVDLAGRMVFNDKGVEVFNFGKNKGKPVADVLKREPGYYDWMMQGDFPLDTKRKLTQIKLRGFQM